METKPRPDFIVGELVEERTRECGGNGRGVEGVCVVATKEDFFKTHGYYIDTILYNRLFNRMDPGYYSEPVYIKDLKNGMTFWNGKYMLFRIWNPELDQFGKMLAEVENGS